MILMKPSFFWAFLLNIWYSVIFFVNEDFPQFSKATSELLTILMKLLFPALEIPHNNKFIEVFEITDSILSTKLLTKYFEVTFPLSL